MVARVLGVQCAQADGAAVEIEVPPVDPELPESEPDRQGLIEQLAFLVEYGHDGLISVLGSVRVPQLRVGPLAAERHAPLPGRRSVQELRTEFLHRAVSFHHTSCEPALPTDGTDAGIEGDGVGAKGRDDMNVCDRVFPRLPGQVDIARQALQFHPGLALDDAIRSHEVLRFLLQGPSRQESRKHVGLARPDVLRDIELAARKPDLAGFLPIDQDAGVGLHHAEIQQDATTVPCLRHADLAKIPCLIQAAKIESAREPGREEHVLRGRSHIPRDRARPDSGHFEPAPAVSPGRRLLAWCLLDRHETPETVDADSFPSGGSLPPGIA